MSNRVSFYVVVPDEKNRVPRIGPILYDGVTYEIKIMKLTKFMNEFSGGHGDPSPLIKDCPVHYVCSSLELYKTLFALDEEKCTSGVTSIDVYHLKDKNMVKMMMFKELSFSGQIFKSIVGRVDKKNVKASLEDVIEKSKKRPWM